MRNGGRASGEAPMVVDQNGTWGYSGPLWRVARFPTKCRMLLPAARSRVGGSVPN
jgi:hypothetical protein